MLMVIFAAFLLLTIVIRLLAGNKDRDWSAPGQSPVCMAGVMKTCFVRGAVTGRLAVARGNGEAA